MAIKPVEHAAVKGQVLTLAEVAAWVQDAMRSGATGKEVVAVKMTFGGKLQKIKVDVKADASTGTCTA
ncbi:hypothetical protein [Streptomyces sp. NPDC056670]|uniref:hypothetical protein n=1 Tax=Streptomyces sp. NPDC056670 TaxID=3345904 RepID=UPI0036CAF567